MAFRNCFKNSSDDLNSGQHIGRKKAKTIYKASVDLANNGGVYHKKTPSGQSNGIYVGDINISRNGTKCLIGATSYDALLSVTNGKYLEQPVSFDIRESQDLWSGSIYKMDLSGAVSILSHPDGSANTFSYPPNLFANQTYPKLIPPSDQGLIVDPCYNIFYPNKPGISELNTISSCYLKYERAYQQYRTPILLNNSYITNYVNSKNGYVGDYFYPKSFSFDCCSNFIEAFYNNTPTTFTYSDGSSFTSVDTILTANSYNPPSGQSLTKVNIGTIVTSIGDDSVFYGQTTLTEVTFDTDSQITSIGDFAFGACSVLASFTIPASVTSIGASVFVGCTSLTTINVEVGNTAYSSDITGVLFDINKHDLIQYPIGNPTTEYTIPNTVTSVKESAFFGAGTLTSLIVPASVTSIAPDAFAGSGLTNVTLQSEVSLTNLGLSTGPSQVFFGTGPVVTITVLAT